MELEGFDFILALWPCLSGSFIVPVTAWIKGKIPMDLPLGGKGISVALSIVTVLVINWLASLELMPKEIALWVITTELVSGGAHSIWKTKKKNSLPKKPKK